MTTMTTTISTISATFAISGIDLQIPTNSCSGVVIILVEAVIVSYSVVN